jgi:hypothetical protein
MNIFVLDTNPYNAASMMCDKHVVKMIVESCQMLSTVHLLGKDYGHPIINSENFNHYKLSFKNHPCTVWARQSHDNYLWLAEHAIGLTEEYNFRYAKNHKCEPMVDWYLRHVPEYITFGELTPFAQAMPDKYKCDYAVTAYRNYYIGEKSRFAKWKMGIIPEWYINGLNEVHKIEQTS